MKKFAIGCLSILGLIFLVGMCSTILTTPNGTVGGTAAAIDPAARARVDSIAREPVLELRGWNWGESAGGSFAEAQGQITNISSEPLRNLRAVVTFSTKGGEFIASDDALIEYNPLMPGQTSPWKVLTRFNPLMNKASVEFSTLGGQVLVHRTKDKK